MARGQKRQREEQPPAQQEERQHDEEQPDRRGQMAEIARRRAAHFANFQEEGGDADNADNIHAGGSQARTLGPWSSAVELINERERATEKRMAKLQDGGRKGLDLTAPVHWQPRRDPALGARRPSGVPSLRALCQALLVNYIDCVESLAGVPDTIRTELAASVCAQRRLSAQVAQCFAQDAPSELVLPDCSALDREALVAVVREVVTPRLERLELGMCGRGFGDRSLKATLQGADAIEEAAEVFARTAAQCPGSVLPHVTKLKLSGAYRLNAEGLITVLKVLPGLRHLEIPDASRITSSLLSHLPVLTPHLRRLDVGDCRALDAASLCQYLPMLKHLTHITLDGILEVDDSVLRAVGQGCPQLSHVSLNRCTAVTDGGVAALAAACPQLEALKCNMCDKVTDKGLAALGSHCRRLKVLSVQKLPKITDQGVIAVVEHGALEDLCLHSAVAVTDRTLQALAAHCHGSLTHLDSSFCYRLSPDALGALVDACPGLGRLVVFGCSQLTDRFAHGHGNDSLASNGVFGLGTAVTVAAV